MANKPIAEMKWNSKNTQPTGKQKKSKEGKRKHITNRKL